jgi:hypothetical protein
MGNSLMYSLTMGWFLSSWKRTRVRAQSHFQGHTRSRNADSALGESRPKQRSRSLWASGALRLVTSGAEATEASHQLVSQAESLQVKWQ